MRGCRRRTTPAPCPESHGWPPFIVVVDVGHAIELFRGLLGPGQELPATFPDRRGFRIYLDDLHDTEVRARLRAVWLDPHALDPAKRSARVTRDIAGRLAAVGKLLEDRGHAAEPVAHFLMRCLFTMFAEDTGLLAEGCFTRLLDEARGAPDSFAPLLEGLWTDMDRGGFCAVMRGQVRHFNGRAVRRQQRHRAEPRGDRRAVRGRAPRLAPCRAGDLRHAAGNRRWSRASGGGWARTTPPARMSSGW